MQTSKPQTVPVKRVIHIALRKSIVVSVFWALCVVFDTHHIFQHIGHVGEFAFGSIADHAVFEWFGK